MNEAIRAQLSAFVDGELPDNEKELLLRRLSQDEELRHELGRYLAIGRAMRGELQPAGVDLLRERIGSAIESGDELDLGEEDAGGSGRSLRPLAGFAIAASVALVAIIGLQQITSNGGGVVDPPAPDLTADNAITEPPVDDLLEQLILHHDAAGPENNIKTVLSSFELEREAMLDEYEAEQFEEPDAPPEDEVTPEPAVE